MAKTWMQADDAPEWQPAEVNWDIYRSDLKTSKMLIKRMRPVIDFEIPILPQPPRYDPASVPVTKPVGLHLDCDAHIDETKRAFVVDKIILPREPFIDLDDPRQRRAYYIIGWPDLPCARPAVDCTKATEYVSPHAIEQWEYQDFLRREEEREVAEAEAAIAAVAAAIAAEKGKDVAGVDSRILPNGKKKPGRKPKNARLQDRPPPTPQLDSEQEEMLAKRKQGPSLSTPQKSRIAQLDAEMAMDLLDNIGDSMDDDGGDMEELLRRQMEIDSSDVDSVDGNGHDIDRESPRPNTVASGFPSLSRTGNAGPNSSRNEPLTLSSFRAGLRPSEPTHVRPNVASSSSGLTSAELPGVRPSQSQRQHQHRPPPPSRPSVFSPYERLTQNMGQVSTTPIALPQNTSLPPKSKTSTSPTQTTRPSTKTRPQPHISQGPSSSAQPPSSNSSHGFTPTNRSTPVAGSFPRPPKRSAEGSKENTPTIPRGKSERKQKEPKLSHPPPEAEAFVVKRLEADEIIDGVQCFKVRWEGDWPADQNPTWEPQDNISAKLVKAYLKRKAEKEAKQQAKDTAMGSLRGGGAKPKGKQQSTLTDWAKKFNYGSVSDAFEGNAELEQSKAAWAEANDGGGEDDDDELAGDAEEVLVVDTKRTADEREREAAEKRKSLGVHLAANLANI